MSEPQGNDNPTDQTLEPSEIEIVEDETPQAGRPPTEKTKTQLFTERLNTYQTLEEAKAHIKEIAENLGVKKSLGYKALKQTRFTLEQAQTIKPEVPTVKIPETPKEELTPPEPEILEPQAEVPQAQVVEPTTIEPRPLEPTLPLPMPSKELARTPIVEKCEPILERAVGRIFNHGLEALTGSKDMLTSEEAKDTATLMPILLWRISKVSMTEDQFIDATALSHFGSIIVKVISLKLKERRERIVPPKPQKKEKPAPPGTQANLEPPKPSEPTEADLAQKKQSQNPTFLGKL